MPAWLGPRLRSRLGLLAGLAVAALAAACARGVPDVGPEDIPRLERSVAASPDDLDLRTQLGVAYYRAERPRAARATLGRAVEAGATAGAAFLYLGLASEALEDWAGAREAYSRYLETGRFDPLKDDLRTRLALIVRRELQAEARATLAREAELSAQEPEPRSLAVFPLRFVGEREDLRPLSVALADMMTTDFSLVGGVTVLDRTRVSTLLQEMALTDAGFTAPATGARAGRLLRAEHVVQGAVTTLGEDALRMDASVLDPLRASAVADLVDEGRLQALFDVEKEIVFGVLDALDVPLTPAEREAIGENRAANLQAFLLYGRGLQALDRGDYREAAAFFQQAVQLDPGFARARTRAQEAAQLEVATATSAEEISVAAARELPGGEGPVGAAEVSALSPVHQGGTEDILQQTADELIPTPSSPLLGSGDPGEGSSQQAGNRDPAQEGQGQEGVTQTTTGVIRLTIRRPGEGP